MKKLMMMAIWAASATAAFAGDSEPLKAILKSTSYADAAKLVESTLDQLANSEEKAKAYNKLVSLAMEKFNKESAVILKNETAEQLKQQPEAYDTLGYNNAAYNALISAIECDKYDRMPNVKGKVKPKYADANRDQIWNARVQLVNAGQEAAQKMDTPNVLKYWGTFLDTNDAPLFDGIDKSTQSSYFGQVALYTARFAYQGNDIEACKRYCDQAAKDPAQAKEATNLKLYISQQSLKTKADSVQFVNDLKAMYAQDESNDDVFNMLFNMYDGMGEKEAQNKLVDDKLAKNPNDFVALFDKALIKMNENDADAAIDLLKKAISVKDDDALPYTYLGACLHVKGSNAEKRTEARPYYEEAVKYLDKAKELDPDMQRAKWGYNRYQAYYGLYGADHELTKKAEAESH